METNYQRQQWLRRFFIYGIPSIIVLAFGFQNCGSGFELQNPSSSLSMSSEGISGKVCATNSPAGQALVRKLNRQEINYSLQDILGVTGDYTSSLTPDASDLNGFTNNAENLQIDSDNLYTLLYSTQTAVNDALSKTGSTLLQCANNLQNLACAQVKIADLAKRAYRRPIAAAEVTKLSAIFSTAQSQGFSFKDSLGFAMLRIFMSPDFLYRSSYSGIADANGTRLSQHELATRMAYFLWSSAPDATLLAAADNNQLQTEAEIRVQVKRLLLDAKADRFIRNFTDEWIGMQKLQAAFRDGLTDQLKADMQAETERMMQAVMREDKSIVDIVGADYSYINANLAAHYGITGVTGTNLRRVDFSPLQIPRRGLLTQGSLLTLTSSPSETKPVARGAQILTNITCNPPPPFPDGLTVTPISDSNTGASIREKMEIHRQGTTCYGCHKEMDPVGLGLENYDQLGRFRTKYASGNPVEAYGTIRGVAFQNGMQLIDFITQQNDFKRCITKKLMGYAIGRSMTASDQCAIQTIGDNFGAKERSFSDLISAIILSEQFNYNQTTSRGE